MTLLIPLWESFARVGIYLWTDRKVLSPILIFYNSSLVILSLVFHPSFKQCCPLGSSYLVGKVLRIGV